MNIWILLGATLIIAYFAQKYIAEKINVPAVAIFMVLGVVLGQSGFNLYSQGVYDKLGFISDIVLGIISFIIGSELSLRVLKKLGKAIVFIAVGEVIVATVFVIGAILLFTNTPLPTAIMLGAVASATAPAATVYVIRQYKTKGPLTSTILGIVGIDDAISLIVYVFASVAVPSMLVGNSSIDFMHVLTTAGKEIGMAVLIGSIAGFLYVKIASKISLKEILLMICMGFIVLLTGLAKHFEVSQLLVLMVFGIVSVGMDEELVERTKHPVELLYELMVPLFFVLAASTFQYKYAVATFGVGLVYTFARMFGKYIGAYTGALLGKTDSITRNYVGLGLFPQVGVAFGLAITIQATIGTNYGEAGKTLALTITNVLIWTTFITEVVGPILTKMALTKAGEVNKNTDSIV